MKKREENCAKSWIRRFLDGKACGQGYDGKDVFLSSGGISLYAGAETYIRDTAWSCTDLAEQEACMEILTWEMMEEDAFGMTGYM